MLEELSVRDFALIDRLSVSFAKGFTILSGETGAGKSLLIGAIGFLLGAKADTGVIRTGAEEALVTGSFDLTGDREALEWLAVRGFDSEDGRLLIRRSIKAGGRSQVFVQGQPALRGDLVELTSRLVDLHGQHDQQSLLQPENHRVLLDRYAGIVAEVEAYSSRFAELTKKKRDFETAETSEKERARELDFLRFTVAEIEGARLKPGEIDDLEAEERVLSQHERLFESIETAHGALSESEGGGILAILRRVRSALDSATTIDPTISSISRRMDDAYYELEDMADSLRSYAGNLRFSPDRLEAIESRLAEIGKLRKKYGHGVDEILERLQLDRERLGILETWEEDKEALAAEIATLETKVLDLAEALSGKRLAAAAGLSAGVEKVLALLGMGKARFVIQVARKGAEGGKAVVGQFGIDEVEFLIAPNPGEALKSLAKIASGGELSRVALAAKTIFARNDRASTLIFDEVDAGIGGEVAVAVGEHLDALGSYKQVLCITHLASIAARADTHYRVEKNVESGRTTTRLVRVEGRARAEEIARMLAGDPEGEASIAHATELLRKYGHWRD
jgi:DNA repair protein RecN (Recombination protein N)